MMVQTMLVKRTLLLLTAMLAALVLASGVALAVNKVCPSGTTEQNPCLGTNKTKRTLGKDTLIGTSGPDYIKALSGNDQISGGAGNDTTDGGGGNDTYSYTGGGGTDSLIDSGGTDTLNFSAFTGLNGAGIHAHLAPELAGSNFVTGPNGERINLSSGTVIEKVTGSSGHDDIRTGGATNTLQPGPRPGGSDTLRDLGGDNGIPASSDTYSGFSASGYGHVHIEDYGGTADKLVLPFASTDVYFEATNGDDDPALDSLVMLTSATDSIMNPGQLEPWYEYKLRIEQIQFTDGIMTIGSETPAQTLSGSKTADSAEAQVQKLNEASSLDSAEKEKRSKAAKKIAAEAQKKAQELDKKLAASGGEEKR